VVLLLPSQVVKLGSRRGPVLSPTVSAVAVPVSVVPDKQEILWLQQKNTRKNHKNKKKQKNTPIFLPSRCTQRELLHFRGVRCVASVVVDARLYHQCVGGPNGVLRQCGGWHGVLLVLPFMSDT